MIEIIAFIIFIAIIIVAQKFMKPISLVDGNEPNPLVGVWLMEGVDEKGERGIRYNFPNKQDISIAGFLILEKGISLQMGYLDSDKTNYQPRFRELKYKEGDIYIYEDIFSRMELKLIEGVLFGTYFNTLNKVFSDTSKENGYATFKDLKLDSKIKEAIVDSVVDKESHYQFKPKLSDSDNLS